VAGRHHPDAGLRAEVAELAALLAQVVVLAAAVARSAAPRGATVMADSPELAAAKRLLDEAKDQGFRFERLAPGEDGPLRGGGAGHS
jgi:hypothetical protein